MAELPPITVATPSPETTITATVHRSHAGRIMDALVFVAAFLVALLDSLGAINFAALGLTPTQAAWAALIYPAIRFSLTYRAARLIDVQTKPGGQDQG